MKNKITEWKLVDYIKSKEDLFDFMEAVLEEKDFTFFIIACKDVIRIAKKHGFYTRKDYLKLYYKKNKKRINEYNRKYHAEHTEQFKEYQKKYRNEHKEHLNKLQKNWREKTKKARAEYFHKWYMKKHGITETRPYTKKGKKNENKAN